MSSPSQLRHRVLRAYRGLLRAQQRVFAGDQGVLRRAQQEARQHFQAQRGLQGVEPVTQAVRLAEEATLFLGNEVVQAVQDPTSGQYAIHLDREHARADEGEWVDLSVEPVTEKLMQRQRQAPRVRKMEGYKGQDPSSPK